MLKSIRANEHQLLYLAKKARDGSLGTMAGNLWKKRLDTGKWQLRISYKSCANPVHEVFHLPYVCGRELEQLFANLFISFLPRALFFFRLFLCLSVGSLHSPSSPIPSSSPPAPSSPFFVFFPYFVVFPFSLTILSGSHHPIPPPSSSPFFFFFFSLPTCSSPLLLLL
ncbi:hypothetical protein FGIG_11726 [Fasciola gigantica]|uniref:Uncharacterized protein n=1 Tax=Fasciola gigantica TaxID=46835 RepID=A0A504Y674_FASGI|nr:hypothetical protein FGIG_11726 [Fasciola gigantica]